MRSNGRQAELHAIVAGHRQEAVGEQLQALEAAAGFEEERMHDRRPLVPQRRAAAPKDDYGHVVLRYQAIQLLDEICVDCCSLVIICVAIFPWFLFLLCVVLFLNFLLFEFLCSLKN